MKTIYEIELVAGEFDPIITYHTESESEMNQLMDGAKKSWVTRSIAS